MRKLFVLLFCTILLVGTISAFDFDNVKEFKKLDNEKYGKISIKNAFGLPLIGKYLAEYKLTENTDQCLINCHAQGTVKLYTKGKLFNGVKFKGRDNRLKNIENKILIKVTESYEVSIDDYSEVCSNKNVNGTMTYVCEQEKVGSHTETRYKEVWKEYHGEVLDKGTYEWRIEGRKNPYESVDWIGNAFGNDLTEWAWWNGNWQKKKPIYINTTSSVSKNNVSVLINIPYDSDMLANFSDLRFLDDKEHWEKLKSVVRISSTRYIKKTKKESEEIRYYITSLLPDSKKMNDIVRSHWSVEKNLHWRLDVTFNEDKLSKRKDNSAANFNIICKMAMTSIDKESSKKISLQKKRLIAAWNDNYREKILKS